MKSNTTIFMTVIVMLLLGAFLVIRDNLSLPVVAFDALDMTKCVYIEDQGQIKPCSDLRLPKRYFIVLVDGENLPASLCADGHKQFC